MKKTLKINNSPRRIALTAVSIALSGVIVATPISSVSAAPKKPAKPAAIRIVPPTAPAPAIEPLITQEAFDSEKSDAEQRGGRNLANADIMNDGVLSESFLNLRSRIIGGPVYENGKASTHSYAGIKTADDLYQFLSWINDDSNYNKLSDDAKFAAAQMTPLLAFQGFYNRAMKLVESEPIAHSMVVTTLRTFASGVIVYFPTEQWTAGLKYLVMPSSTMGGDITTEIDFHRFLERELVPAVIKMKNRLEALNFKKQNIYFDNQVMYGTASFFSDRDRYIRIGEAERRATLSGVYYVLSGLESLNAYNLNGIFESIEKIGKNYGWNALSYDPGKSTSKKRFEILREISEKRGLFELRPGGEGWMKASFSSLQYAVANTAWSWAEIKGRSKEKDSGNSLFDPRAFMSFSRMIGAGINNMEYIVGTNKGESSVRSAVVSLDSTPVNLSAFFNDPPKNLTKLMPTQFDESPYVNYAQINGKKREWHNFLNGRPTGWDLREFQKCFPNVKSSNDVTRVARIMAQSWGGWLLGIPMSALVL